MTDEERIERIDIALSWVPHSHDDIRKLAEDAVKDLILEREDWREAVQAHLADHLIDDWTRAHLEGCLAARGLKP